jgi:hypothetical protein
MEGKMAAPCIRVPCECGDCYLPNSEVGNWLWVRLRRLRTALRVRFLGRPGRFGRQGEVLVPRWVHQAFEDPQE